MNEDKVCERRLVFESKEDFEKARLFLLGSFGVHPPVILGKQVYCGWIYNPGPEIQWCHISVEEWSAEGNLVILCPYCLKRLERYFKKVLHKKYPVDPDYRGGPYIFSDYP